MLSDFRLGALKILCKFDPLTCFFKGVEVFNCTICGDIIGWPYNILQNPFSGIDGYRFELNDLNCWETKEIAVAAVSLSFFLWTSIEISDRSVSRNETIRRIKLSPAHRAGTSLGDCFDRRGEAGGRRKNREVDRTSEQGEWLFAGGLQLLRNPAREVIWSPERMEETVRRKNSLTTHTRKTTAVADSKEG
ncbi:hypothetical protein LXL04_008507 [Taraxacum kok-saghyz]